MPLSIGTRLGPYEILAAIGAGGMGEVYRARDTRLERTVAIKVLPEALAADPHFRERFEREARTISQLNHPHICTLHDLGRENNIDYLVMEFVDGETLDQRVRLGGIPVPDALALARQIASALEAAHDRGIVHRDLKPANIKIVDGQIKVLDFGLAKDLAVTEMSQTMSPTVLAGATRAGVILGTAAYMSPEQARGLPVDRRADIWAFGCVLYEMLTGQQAFGGPTVTDSIASLIHKEPSWDLLPSDTPDLVRRMLRRCLQKDPKKRLRDIADAATDLDDVGTVPATRSVAASTAARAPGGARVVLGAVTAASLLVAAFFVGSWWRARQQPRATEWISERLGGPVMSYAPRLSPDGQTVAFGAVVDGQEQPAIMKPQAGTWALLSHNTVRAGMQDLSWSRDGTRIFFDRVFDVPLGVFSIPALGGDERLVLENAMAPQVLPDGSLLVTRINAARVAQLHRFWLDTGRVEPLPALMARTVTATAVRAFPDGHEAVFYGRPADTTDALDTLYAINLDSKRVRRLVPPSAIEAPWWSIPLAVTPDGRSVCFARASGASYQVVEIPRDGAGTTRVLATLMSRPLYLDVGPDGSLYVDQVTQSTELVSWTPASGQLDRLELPDIYYTNYNAAVPLPDGRILFQARIAGREQVMVMAPGRATEPFVDTPEMTLFPVAPVGVDRAAFLIGAVPNRKMAIASIDGHIRHRFDHLDGNNVVALAGSPDGHTLFYVISGVVWAVPADESTPPRRVHDGDSVAVDPRGEYLVIKLQAGEKLSLVRVPLSGGADQPIPIAGDIRLTGDTLSPTAVAPDGRIAVRIGRKESWFWPGGILDPKTGAVTPISKSFSMDMMSPGWTPDGRVVAAGLSARSTLWRFRPLQ